RPVEDRTKHFRHAAGAEALDQPVAAKWANDRLQALRLSHAAGPSCDKIANGASTVSTSAPDAGPAPCRPAKTSGTDPTQERFAVAARGADAHPSRRRAERRQDQRQRRGD